MRTWSVLLLVILSGCASVPDVTLTYYPAKWTATATVVQSVGCGPDKERLVVAATPSISTTYFSNTALPRTIKVSDLSRWYADSELTMEFSEDGRLKAVNQSTTGQGETILKSAVTLLTTPGLFSVFSIADPASACAMVEKLGGGKPIALTYKAEVNSVNFAGRDLLAAPDSVGIDKELGKFLPKYTLDAGPATAGDNAPSFTGAKGDVVELTLQKIGQFDLTIKRDGTPIGTSRISVPLDETYPLPIPKAQLFGKSSLGLTLSDSGAITKITYGRLSGSVGVLNVLGAISASESPATKAAELKAEADLIAQQQRLVLCQTKPADCR